MIKKRFIYSGKKMEVKEIAEKLEKSKQFEKWKAKHKKACLADTFILADNEARTEWQLGYYDPTTEKITVFVVGEEIIEKPEDDVFSKDGKINALELDKVSIELEEALKLCDKFCKNEYPREEAVKKIAVLQCLDLGQVWNISTITKSYKTINAKIDAATGKVLSHTLTSLFDFVKQ